VVTILLEEIPLDSSLLLKQQLADDLNATGLLPLLYLAHEASASWPTLGEMISSGRRLVIFSDRREPKSILQSGLVGGGGGVTLGGGGVSRAWDLFVWDFAVETPFAFFTYKDLENSEVYSLSALALLVQKYKY
jgi:hypothetical protein